MPNTLRILLLIKDKNPMGPYRPGTCPPLFMIMTVMIMTVNDIHRENPSRHLKAENTVLVSGLLNSIFFTAALKARSALNTELRKSKVRLCRYRNTEHQHGL